MNNRKGLSNMKCVKMFGSIAFASLVLAMITSYLMAMTSGILSLLFGCGSLASGTCFTYAVSKIFSAVEQKKV